MKLAMIDVAFDVLKGNNRPLLFIDLFNEVSEIKQLTQNQKENEIAQFFTDLTLDDRYINLRDNMWDLRIRHKFEDIKRNYDENDDDDEIDEDE
ncbi:MAG: DNA-directed RNA polymerase subunit delta [Breznakia sp.]